MAEVVPPVPFKAEVVNENGYISPAWAGFIKQLYSRIGGPVALSNTDLTTYIGSIPTLQASVTSLTSTVATLQSRIDDLSQGRQL